MLRTVARGLSKAYTRSVGARKGAGASVRNMVTLNEKERGEEARYFAQQDAKSMADMKKTMNDILDQADGSEEKQELLKILGKQNYRLALLLYFPYIAATGMCS